MSRAHANVVAGEGDESDSDDEDWLDDVDVPELTAEDIRAAGLESPFVTPHVTPKAEASNGTFGGNVPAERREGAAGTAGVGAGVGTRVVPGDDAARDAGARDVGTTFQIGEPSVSAPAVRPAVVVPTTATQRKLATRIAAGRKAMYVKHASGRELASSFMRGTEEALSAAGAHCHDIDDSVRHLTANLAELASTGRTEWARVPEKSRPPPDIYDRALRG